MVGLGRTLALLAVAAGAPGALAAAGSTGLAGTWHRLPAAPVAPNGGVASVWTGTGLLLFGREESLDSTGAVVRRVAVAASYDPSARAWRRLPSPGPTAGFANVSAAWTGKEALFFGQGTRLAYDPARNRWRRLRSSRLLAVHDGFAVVAWTGRELVGWGGGCCGDAFDDGVAYDPATNRWRALPQAPLTPGGSAGAWTGRELVVLSRDIGPDGRRYPSRLARAAAYDPATNTWRRIPTPPALGGAATWDGRDVLLVGAGRRGRAALAYDPRANRWRRLAALPSARFGAAVAWAGTRLLLWGGYRTAGGRGYPLVARRGLAYEPARDRWSLLPRAPVAGRSGATAVWTGRALVVWGGTNPRRPLGTGSVTYADGAELVPR